MDKIWLQSYQQGVPAEIDPDEFGSLGELVDSCVSKYSDRVAFICMGAQITYAELDRLARGFAAYLQTVLKLP